MPVIDMHAHIIPRTFSQMVRNGKIEGVSFVQKPPEMLSFNGNFHPYNDLFHDVQAQFAFMDEHGVDMQAISVSPRLFFYEYAPGKCAEICRICNDDIWELYKQHPSKFIPVGGLPLQDTGFALGELERIHALGFRLVQIGTSVGRHTLDEAFLEPVYKKLEIYKMPVIIHPLIVNDDWKIKQYYLHNFIGNPYQTAAAAANLIFGGTLDQCPDIKFILVHGGGDIPYQLGRMNHGFSVRPSAENECSKTPETYIKRNFWFDALTHSTEALKFLLELVGPERVLFGTDYPYDMADYEELEKLKKMGCDSSVIAGISGENFLKLIF